MNALYPVTVTHTRLRPRRHHLRYRAAYLLIDLAHPPQLRLLATARSGLFSFHPHDHGDGSGDLIAYVQSRLAEAGLPAAADIALLTMPRFLGYAFNPLSLFFCRNGAGALSAILYEVNNTFGQRHAYLLPVTQNAAAIRQHCDKQFFVSPFLPMRLQYRFSLNPPGEQLNLQITVEDAGETVLHAAMSGTRQALTNAALLRLALAMPFLGLKIIGAIHWEALKLWLKGVRLHRRPPPPSRPVSFPNPGSAPP